MKPYNKSRKWTKGLAGTRKSIASSHRDRCLRVDKRAARQEAKRAAKDDLELYKQGKIPHWSLHKVDQRILEEQA